jgi:hypothetical protein
VEHHHPVAEAPVAGEESAGRDLGVAGVGADREDRAVGRVRPRREGDRRDEDESRARGAGARRAF